MRKRGLWQYVMLMLLMAVMVGAGVQPVFATSSSRSDNYEVTEMKFGAGSALESCSSSYCAQVSIGEAALGSAENPVHKAEFGSVTPGEPMLEVIVDPGESNLGKLTTEHTATKTMVVRVRNYLSNGYTLQVVGTPPKYGDHTLGAMASPGAADPGTEQFGINAVANTSPEVGAQPQQVPSVQTSFGELDPSYNTPNQFMYQSGDEIARSLKESGRTDYTISMIVNIANDTPAGDYASDFSAVVVPVF
ncbi:MAG TPA: hypothetical protein VGE13_02595 [Candidatus Saccharimonadales bacterium]